MSVGAHPELDPAGSIFARQLRGLDRSAPGDQPGELRLHLRKQMTPDGGPDSIGANQRQRQFLMARRAAALDHGQPPGVGDDVFELAAEPELDIGMVVDLGLQRRLQVGAVHHPIGGSGTQRGGFAQRQAGDFAAVTARAARRGCSPKSISTRLALGESCRPAPVSSRHSAFSRMMTRKPRRASASEAVNPPIPAPAMMMVRDAATDWSGDFIFQHTFRRPGFPGFEVAGQTVQGRAIGADDLVVVAEIEEDMGMIERRIGADTHEFLRADLNDRNAGLVVKVRNHMIGHRIHPEWQWRQTHSTTRGHLICRASRRRV